MSIKYLGEQFDIHAGGIDHIPIHHTNEIAQSEAATGKKPWVRYWLHNEFLVMDKGKMSKSAGGFLTLQKLIDEGYDPLDYRYFLLGAHYRSQLQFSWESLTGAKNARKSLLDKFRALANKTTEFTENTENTEKEANLRAVPQDSFPPCPSVVNSSFDKALEDDLNTPRALAELWGLLKEGSAAPQTLAAALDMDTVLGLGLEAALTAEQPAENENLVREIEALITERTAAKKAKDFARADGIRQSLKDRGIALEDGPNGTTWRRIEL
jgi:cysteinyl-tRNA synthetase